MHEDSNPRTAQHLSRRSFLQGVAGGACLLALPYGGVWAASKSRSLSFVHTHTGERLSVDYCRDGVYQENCLSQVNRFLRDFRSGEIHPIDPQLLDILHGLQALTDREATYEVISAYRSRNTNALLRKSSTGVAERSLHLEGRAIDIRMTGFPTHKLRDFARTLQRGGVGFYAKSDFVHVDTGRVREWVG